MKEYLFSDSEVWHRSIKANNWNSAVRIARDQFLIKGRLRIKVWNGNTREYKLDKSDYIFTLRLVD